MFECECGVKLKNPKMPVYCRCGRVHGKGVKSSQHPGTAAWHKLHRHPFTVARWEPAEVQHWYEQWVAIDVPRGCGCSSKWRRLTQQWAPDFSSRESFFAWTVDRHNDVNERLGRRTWSHHEARLLYDMHYAISQPEDIKPTRPIAVVSIASGNHLPMLAQTRPLRISYAHRIGADLIELTDDRWPDWPMANKWRLANVAKHYQRVLFVDSDVVLKRDAPNIFNIVPRFSIGLVDEYPIVRANGAVQYGYTEEFALVAREHDCPTPNWCPNGGVIVLPRELAHVYEPPKLMPVNRWCMDQYLLAINCELAKSRVTFIDGRWNWGWIDKRFWAGMEAAYFVHVNGSGSGEYRKQLLDRITQGNYERLDPPAEKWRPDYYGADH